MRKLAVIIEGVVSDDESNQDAVKRLVVAVRNAVGIHVKEFPPRDDGNLMVVVQPVGADAAPMFAALVDGGQN